MFDNGRVILGAGFLVAPDLVLTCAHVVHDQRDLRVSFTQAERRDLLGLPAALHSRGAWHDPGDRGDVAVLRLDQPIALSPAPLLTKPVATTGQTAHGFPLDHGEIGAPLKLNLITEDLVGEWWHVEAATPYAEVPRRGFSGAAVYDETSGAVIGMITDCSEHPRRMTGRVLPISAIRRHWEELDDLLDLDWLPARLRRELRVLVHGVSTAVNLRDLMDRVFHDTVGHRDFDSVWDAIRYVGDELHGRDRMALFLPELADAISRSAERRKLQGWIHRHIQLPESPAERATAIVVRVDSMKDGYELTLHPLHDGKPDPGTVPVRVRESELRAKVEAGFDAVRRQVAGSDPVIEFVLPQAMMHQPVDEWDFAEETPLIGYRVVIRCLDRLTDVVKWDQWVSRAGHLRKEPRALPETVGCRGEEPSRLYLRLQLKKKACVQIHASRPDDALLAKALHAGLPVMIWPRARCPEPEHSTCTARHLLEDLAPRVGDARPDDLPELVRTLRLEAALEEHGAPHCGRGLTLLWDDPDRMPDPPAHMPEYGPEED
ncbi:trypsin-like peptidase domain-containing protein [Nonomuraea sp. K274]|uniref:Trypsin-like peptidase domain-containing protein n=1 Tax=Nonomuraea cypriaca TaxID=1187855 RepID=A0A931AIR9_9ACTN|nr:trypsin-like peptidase domain-containing protein [Nonomuraea cypriaca]MBF8191253.1 trypsin-like peptidase domain-containing protein [Nonomuraea cypriaca]